MAVDVATKTPQTRQRADKTLSLRAFTALFCTKNTKPNLNNTERLEKLKLETWS